MNEPPALTAGLVSALRTFRATALTRLATKMGLDPAKLDIRDALTRLDDRQIIDQLVELNLPFWRRGLNFILAGWRHRPD